MEAWLDDLLQLLTETSPTERDIRIRVEQAVQSLGFERFFFAYRPMLPLSKARMKWLHNCPRQWCDLYVEKEFFLVDPRVKASYPGRTALTWSEALFKDAPDLWQEMQTFGFRHGWTYAVQNGLHDQGILSLSRSSAAITERELQDKQQSMQLVAWFCYVACAKLWRDETVSDLPNLTERESEIMRWSADGKSAQDIADILSISKNTVDFHIKNSVNKLNAPNKTAAVMQATVLGMLNG